MQGNWNDEQDQSQEPTTSPGTGKGSEAIPDSKGASVMAKTSALIWRRVVPVQSASWILPKNIIPSGVIWRTKQQAPILDRPESSVRGIVGSVRALSIRGDTITGGIRWASDASGMNCQQKLAAGIVVLRPDIVPFEIVELRAGQELKGVKGPGEVVTRWQIASFTLVAGET